MKLLQIVPGYGKIENALYDYAVVLAWELEKYGITSVFEMEKANDVDAVFLNYSNYGYQKRGLPWQLYSQLSTLNRNKKIPVYTFFHEVYAGRERILTSSYWLHPLQKRLYKLFFHLSLAAFCGNEVIRKIITTENNQADKLYYTPLFSNIPVLENFIPFAERKDIAVVFGTPGRRHEVYRRTEKLNAFCKTLGIKEIIDIGSNYIAEWTTQITVPVTAAGRLGAGAIGDFLRTCKVGFIAYPEQIFGKSGIFAAYAGNGMCIINLDEPLQEPKEGLAENVHYYNERSLINGLFTEPAALSLNIFNWYQPRSAAEHARKISRVLLNEPL